MKKIKVYMAVSRDEYKLPIAISDTAAGLAKMLGIKKQTIYADICRKEGRYLRIEIEVEEDE